MLPRLARIAALPLGAGFVAAMWAVVTVRDLTLTVGATAAARAAVLGASFLGFGAGALIGGRVGDRRVRPLATFARLELVFAGIVAASPALLFLGRLAYVRIGGTAVHGERGAVALAAGLALLAAGAPLGLVGGGLACAARAVETPEDVTRRDLATVLAAFALGASLGGAVESFFLLEAIGARLSAWAASLVAVGIAMAGRRLAPRLPAQSDEKNASGPARGRGIDATGTLELTPEPAPTTLVIGGAFIVGAGALLSREIVARLLEPLIGATSYAQGIVLAVLLVGLAIGAGVYAMSLSAPTIGRLALACALQALALAVPYALGDRIALLALLLRPLGAVGLVGHGAAWMLVASLVLLPAMALAGHSWLLLVGLLGRGSFRAGRDVGLVALAGALGAIAGALSGAFVFLPLLGAPGVWRLSAAMIAALGVGAMVLALLSKRPARTAIAATLVATALTSVALLVGRGPTAAWRYGRIGAGAADDAAHGATRNGLRDWEAAQRARIAWSAEGREGGLALAALDGLTLVESGTAEGGAGPYAATQIMSGLLPAFLHPAPKKALVLGLGTGMTAGWLGRVGSIEEVTVVEPEPLLAGVAKKLGPLNEAVLDNPKVKLKIGDGREHVLVSRDRYDIVVVPSGNPAVGARAGLFTRDFLRAVNARLADGGILAQRLQAYEVDGQTIRTAYATLTSVFPIVETWQTRAGDLLFVASREAVLHDAPKLMTRLGEAPFDRAFEDVWRVSTLEGVLARHVAHPTMALLIGQQEAGRVSTDDKDELAPAFARGVGRRLFDVRELAATARARKEQRPALVGGDVDWTRVEAERSCMPVLDGVAPRQEADHTPEERRRVEALGRYALGLLDAVLPAWAGGGREPVTTIELGMIAEALADAGDPAALSYIDRLAARHPTEAAVARARLAWRQNHAREAVDALASAFVAYRHDPFVLVGVMRRALDLALDLGQRDPALAKELFATLEPPFAADLLSTERRRVVVELAFAIGGDQACVTALAPLEPDVPWRRRLLTRRFSCYQAAGHPLAARAKSDLETFLADARVPFAQGLADVSATSVDDP